MQQSIDAIKDKVNLGTIQLIKGDKKNANFEHNSLDKIIIRNAFHHFSKEKAMLKSIKAALKPDGKLYLYEPVIDLREKSCKQCKYCNKVLKKSKLTAILSKNHYVLEEEVQLENCLLLKYRPKKD